MSWYVINAGYDIDKSFPYSRAITNTLSVSLDYSRQIQNFFSVSLDYSRQIFDSLSGKAFYTFKKPKQNIKFFSKDNNKKR